MIDTAKDALSILYKLPIKSEHIEILKSNLDFLRDRIISLDKECTELKTENNALQNIVTKLKTSQPTGDFKDYGSFKLKKDENGKFFNLPYCPICNRPMTKRFYSYGNDYDYKCNNTDCNDYAIDGDETSKEIAKHL